MPVMIGARRAVHPVLDELLRGYVAFWPLYEGSGQVLNDISGNAYHGQLGSAVGADTNDPLWATWGLNQDPVDDYSVMPIAAINRNEWTIVVAAQSVATTPATQRAFGARYDANNSKLLGFSYVAGTQTASMTTWNGTTAASTSIGSSGGWPAGTWARCSLSFSRTTGIVTGRLISSGRLSTATITNCTGLVTPDIFRLGNIPTATTQPMDGGVALPMVYPWFWTDDDARQDYRAARRWLGTLGAGL